VLYHVDSFVTFSRRCLINRQASFKLNLIAGIMVLALFLVACGGKDTTTTTTKAKPRQAQPIGTPRPAPLATVVATAGPLGDSERPVTILIALPAGETDPNAEAEQTARALTTDLKDKVTVDLGRDFNTEIIFVSEAEALDAICNGYKGNPAAVWASSFTLVSALNQCDAVPVLALQRGTRRDLSMGQTIEIISRKNVGAITSLAGLTFCRLSGEDFVSWVFPSLIFAANKLDPAQDLAGIKDTYPDVDEVDNLAMLRSVYKNECAAAALPPGEFNSLTNSLASALTTDTKRVTSSDVKNTLKVLVPATDTSKLSGSRQGYMIPYEVLIFPPDNLIPADIRTTMSSRVSEFFSDPDTGAENLGNLFNREGLPDAASVQPVITKDYETFQKLVGRVIFSE
jgi:hypothetical protein